MRGRWLDREYWPMLTVRFVLTPWNWRLRPHVYFDDVEGALGYSAVEWLGVEVTWWWANNPTFRKTFRKKGGA